MLPLLDFREADLARRWRPIHDGVMGGRSSGSAVPTADGVRFEGLVSLEDGGGFASFRLEAELPELSEHDGLRLRVRGDGKVYKLGLRTDGDRDGVDWQVPFAALAVGDAHDGGWTSVELAFEDLVPTWRGRLVREAPPFDADAIRQVGILIADRQQGPFALELASIEARRFDTAAARRARTAALASSGAARDR